MRIITGFLKGRKIPMPQTEGVRPTSDRAKEGLFSALQARTSFTGASVLDLFAGSGNLGFEAISRGAASVSFVEQNKVCVGQIRNLASQFELEDSVQVFEWTVERYLESFSGSYDIIFADPPYELSYMQTFPDTVLQRGWLKEDGIFVLEHDKYNDFKDHEQCLYTKAYGRTTVSMFSK